MHIVSEFSHDPFHVHACYANRIENMERQKGHCISRSIQMIFHLRRYFAMCPGILMPLGYFVSGILHSRCVICGQKSHFVIMFDVSEGTKILSKSKCLARPNSCDLFGITPSPKGSRVICLPVLCCLQLHCWMFMNNEYAQLK